MKKRILFLLFFTPLLLLFFFSCKKERSDDFVFRYEERMPITGDSTPVFVGLINEKNQFVDVQQQIDNNPMTFTSCDLGKHKFFEITTYTYLPPRNNLIYMTVYDDIPNNFVWKYELNKDSSTVEDYINRTYSTDFTMTMDNVDNVDSIYIPKTYSPYSSLSYTLNTSTKQLVIKGSKYDLSKHSLLYIRANGEPNFRFFRIKQSLIFNYKNIFFADYKKLEKTEQKKINFFHSDGYHLIVGATTKDSSALLYYRYKDGINLNKPFFLINTPEKNFRKNYELYCHFYGDEYGHIYRNYSSIPSEITLPRTKFTITLNTDNAINISTPEDNVVAYKIESYAQDISKGLKNTIKADFEMRYFISSTNSTNIHLPTEFPKIIIKAYPMLKNMTIKPAEVTAFKYNRALDYRFFLDAFNGRKGNRWSYNFGESAYLRFVEE